MKPPYIVVVDGATLNPGDLSWEAVGAYGSCAVYPTSTPAETLERCRDAEVIISNKVAFDRALIEALPKLKYIGVTATGYNVIDVSAAAERGIVVTNVPTYGTTSVAQMVFALLLELTQHVGHHAATVRAGRWSMSENFCYWDYPLIELEGLTMGIIGCGRIGQATARLADAFGMHVIGYDAAPFQSGLITFAPLDTLLSQSDVISLHCPLTSETRDLINAARLAQMKKTAFVINTSRGTLVNERDLADALNRESLAGAGLDVLTIEPPLPGNPLLTARNCIITPHIAWATRSARRRLMQFTVENLAAWLEGKPRNVVTRQSPGGVS